MKNITDFSNYTFLDWLAYTVVVISALNCGLVGVFGIDLISYLLPGVSLIARSLYIIIGASGLRLLYIVYRNACCDKC